MKIGDFYFHNYGRDNTQTRPRIIPALCVSPFFNPLEIEGISLPVVILSLLVIIYSEPYPASGWFGSHTRKRTAHCTMSNPPSKGRGALMTVRRSGITTSRPTAGARSGWKASSACIEAGPGWAAEYTGCNAKRRRFRRL